MMTNSRQWHPTQVWLLALLGSLVCGGTATAEAAVKPPRIAVATINGEPIYRDELAEILLRRYGRAELESMVRLTVLRQACDKAGAKVTDGEIQAKLEETAARSGVKVEQYLRLFKKERGMDRAQYVAQVVWPQLALRKLVGSTVKVDEEDIQRAFEAKYGERVRVRHIMIQSQRAAVEVWEQIRAGELTFEQAAKKHSIDRATRAVGGVVEPFGRGGTLYPKMETEAFSLQPGELSKIIQLNSGLYQFMECIERLPPEKDVKLAEVRDELEDAIFKRKLLAATQARMKELMDEAEIEINLE